MSDFDLALNHKYRLNGVDLTNVTAVSGFLDDGKSNAMSESAAKITREGGNYRKEWDFKRDRGSRIHAHGELLLRDEPVDVLPDDLGFVKAVSLFIQERQPKVLELEVIVLSALLYGGRLDMIVEIDGEVWLIDLKSGRKYAVEHTLQLAAYRYADGIAVYDEDGKQVSLRPLPKIDRTADLYVFEDGTYSLDEYPADETAFAQFVALLGVHRWTRTDVMKQTIRESKRKAA